jgi:hypothetical protein
MRLLLGLILAIPVTGCGGTTADGISPSQSNLPLVRPYRAAGDPCSLIGESSATAEYLDDSSDLVGCPVTYEDIATFEAQTGAIRIGEKQGYILFTVLR